MMNYSEEVKRFVLFVMLNYMLFYHFIIQMPSIICVEIYYLYIQVTQTNFLFELNIILYLYCLQFNVAHNSCGY